MEKLANRIQDLRTKKEVAKAKQKELAAKRDKVIAEIKEMGVDPNKIDHTLRSWDKDIKVKKAELENKIEKIENEFNKRKNK